MTEDLPLLALYCLLIIAASAFGGLVPLAVRMTHRRMEVALSFVSGVMLGIGLLHLLPHAIMLRSEQAGEEIGHSVIEPLIYWLLVGFLAMFLMERFFSFHQHDPPPPPPELGAGRDGEHKDGHDQAHGNGRDHHHGHYHHDHHHEHAVAGEGQHRLSWGGAFAGLTIHSLIAGVALAASVAAQSGWSEHFGHDHGLAGFGVFLIIFLHKPFDAMTIATLMRAGAISPKRMHLVNGLFGLMVPIGAVLFLLGLQTEGAAEAGVLSIALAFSAGTFLCIALSDVLPELHFHAHDRVKLSVALILGLILAAMVAHFEAASHEHAHEHVRTVEPENAINRGAS